MPPPIPVPAFLSEEPVHPANGSALPPPPPPPPLPGAAPPAAGYEIGQESVKPPVVKPPEVKPGPGGIRRREPGTGVKRRITWVEDHKIAQIKEFEPSDSDDSDDEDGDEESSQSCSCVIQ